MDALPLHVRAADAPRAQAAWRSRPWLLRGSLIAVCAASALVSAHFANPALRVEADPELARLLRAMAVLKAVMIAPALVALLWRCRWPVSSGLGSAYVAGAAMTTGATVWLWNLTSLGTAAVLFHVGVVLLVVGALFDRSGSSHLARRGS